MAYSKTNFKLIPLIPNTKRPRDKGWQEDTYVGTDFTNQIGLAHKDNVNQGFLLPRDVNDELELQLKERKIRKSEFYRILATAWVEGKVT
jgi:hypothetical protein